MAAEVGEAPPIDSHYDAIVVGTGFGSSFFLHKLLARRAIGRVLVLEWGDRRSHRWQIENRANSAIPAKSTFRTDADKPWNFTIGFGGGTNCWFAQTPRFHPNDFRLKSLYGVGADWPVSYEQLEPFYLDAERIMSVSGDADMSAVAPRSGPFPQPPHRLTAPDRLMKAAQPDRHFAMPTARARVATERRSACCASFRCNLCPVDAKFTVLNGMAEIYEAPQVTLLLGSEVRALEADAANVRKVTYRRGGTEHTATADLFVLGANAIHSPAILQRSGLAGELVGRGLHESYGVHVEAYLDGLDNFDGSTITTGLNYGLYDGPFRSEHAGALVYFDNRWIHGLRPERGRFRQILPLMIVTEDLLENENRVTVDGDGAVRVHYKGASAYARRGQEEAFRKLSTLLAPLPIETIEFRSERPTESHLQGTLRMGKGPADSVVDAGLLHHRLRNLVVVGTSVFPSCSCANPSLTAAALSLRAASLLA